MSTLVLDQVSRWYGNVVAVNDVTMRIGPGITGLLGPNGAGKSTLIHLMSGFLAPSSGSVTLGGEPTWHHEQVYRRIGLVPGSISSSATPRRRPSCGRRCESPAVPVKFTTGTSWITWIAAPPLSIASPHGRWPRYISCSASRNPWSGTVPKPCFSRVKM